MRPEILFPLFGDIKTLEGVGPKIREHLIRLKGALIVHLLWHFPVGIIDRSFRPNIEDVLAGRIATLQVMVGRHQKPPSKKVPYKVTCYDDTGKIKLVFFHAHEKYLVDNLPEGKEVIISGIIEKFGGNVQMTHPDYIVGINNAHELPKIEPIYPLTAGLVSKRLQNVIGASLKRVSPLPEWSNESLVKKCGWPTWFNALTLVHHPTCEGDLSLISPARERLAYDELLANQLALGLVREVRIKKKGRIIMASSYLRDKLLESLPFKLTNSQLLTLAEIDTDMTKNTAMLRLIQGDVGSGKTIVAFLGLLNAIENGFQTAFLAPTEILARQHFETLSKMSNNLGIKIDILLGRHKGNARVEKLKRLKAGEIDLLIGTHALFQDGVDYKDLGAIVVDEQHRFGVHQRLALSKKAVIAPDVLVMTATPIPRTLTLTIYGDMDVSRITEKPEGRLPITTRVVEEQRVEQVISGLERMIKKGEQAYWVCPLVEESEVLDVAAAEERFKVLTKRFGNKVGLLHGKMKAVDKDMVMEKFASAQLKILVATTVIEVGVDVKNATIMVIEHAERFGLAQLHQLRGRVGRGSKASSCILIRSSELTPTAHARLSVLRDTEDGFLIAEEDLKLRGAGEILGVKQSGFPEFRIADLSVHADLLATARDDARIILNDDPTLKGPRGINLRTLLYLFEQDNGVRLLGSG
ncbi:MAG: ATP-dependent DNA helicase RecG [Sphingomonadales bacterium]